MTADISKVEPTTVDAKGNGVDQIEVVDTNTTSSEENQERAKMTLTKWLALVSLALSYMTAFQQGACSAAIIKSIDEALGRHIPMAGNTMLIHDQDQLRTTIGCLQETQFPARSPFPSLEA